MHLTGKNCQNVIRRDQLEGNGQRDRIFIIMKIKLTPGVHLSLLCGYRHVCDHDSQTR